MATGSPLGEAFIRLRADGRTFGSDINRTIERTDTSKSGRRLGLGLSKSMGGGFRASVGGALAGGFAKLGIGIAAVAAGGALIKTGLIDPASDLNETINKSNTIFGKNANAINAWASNSAVKLGLSKQAALESASSFGNMFQQLGFAGKAATNMSKRVVQLSADQGSFNNLPTEDVSQRLAAAFRGEFDSLQALIPNINAARVEKVALAKTGKKNAESLTAQEKAAAVLAIVEKDGAAATGDYAKTKDAAANASKTLGARLTDLRANLGTKLLPVFTQVLGGVNRFVSGLEDGSGAGGQFKRAFDKVLPTIKQVGTFIKTTIVPAVTNLIRTVGPPLIGALKAGFGFFTTNVLPILKGVAEFIYTKVVPVLGGILKSALAGLKGAFQTVGDAIEKNRPQLTALLGALKGLATFIVTKVAPVLGPLLKVQFKILGAAISIIITAVAKLWGAFKFLAVTVLEAFGHIIHGVATAFGWIPGIGGKLKKADKAFQEFKDKAIGALNGLGKAGNKVGKDFTAGLAEGIRQGGVVSVAAAQGVAAKVTAAMNGPSGFDSHSPSKKGIKIGGFFSEGIAIGITLKGKKAIDAAKTLVANIKGRLADLRSQARDISNSAADSVRGVLDISGIGAAGTSPSGILAGFASQAKAFAKALAKMAKIGLAPAIIAAVAAAGPSALGAANAFASETKAQVKSDNASMSAIDKAARSAGATARGASGIDKQIAHYQRLEHEMRGIRADMRNGKATLEITNGGKLIVRYVNKANHNAARRGHQ